MDNTYCVPIAAPVGAEHGSVTDHFRKQGQRVAALLDTVPTSGVGLTAKPS
jgi:hypothetical protein